VGGHFRPGDYLTFRVARHDFALPAECVRGILPLHELVSGDAPESWRAGTATLCARSFPVIDLRARLKLRRGSAGRNPCIVVVEGASQEGLSLAGFVADCVSDVVSARARDFRNGKLRIGRPRKVLDPEVVLAGEAAALSL
jgi:chemotaxis signal transduction protein